MSEWPTLDNLQQGCAREVMRAVNGNKRRAAQILGINRRTLKRWLVAEESVENRSGGQNPENTRLKEPQGES
jgi:two-component system NtrC family response regulator